MSAVGSSLASVAFVGSGVLAIAGLLISFLVDHRSPQDLFADGFDQRWGSNLGLDLLKEGWEQPIKNFHAYTHPSALGFSALGEGLPMGRLDGSVARVRPAPFGAYTQT